MPMPNADKTGLEARATISIEQVDHIRSDVPDPAGHDSTRSPHADVLECERALDRSKVRLLAALDAVAGAEAQASAAQARVRELELERHMLEVERNELRREVERLSLVIHRRRPRLVRLARSLVRRMIT